MVTFRRSATSVLVLLMLALAIPSAVARGFGGVALPGFAPDRVLVGFRPGTATETARAIEASVGAREIGIVGAGTHLLKVPAGRVLGVVAALKASPLVHYAEPDWMLAADQTPNDPDFGNQWGLLNTGQSIDVTQDTSISGTTGAAALSTAASTTTTRTSLRISGRIRGRSSSSTHTRTAAASTRTRSARRARTGGMRSDTCATPTTQPRRRGTAR